MRVKRVKNPSKNIHIMGNRKEYQAAYYRKKKAEKEMAEVAEVNELPLTEPQTETTSLDAITDTLPVNKAIAPLAEEPETAGAVNSGWGGFMQGVKDWYTLLTKVGVRITFLENGKFRIAGYVKTTR